MRIILSKTGTVKTLFRFVMRRYSVWTLSCLDRSQITNGLNDSALVGKRLNIIAFLLYSKHRTQAISA